MATKKTTSTAVATRKPSAGAVADIQSRLRAQAAATADKIQQGGGNRIRYSKGKFVLPDGTQHETLDVVIVDFVSKNFYYEGEYDKDNITPPNCFAISSVPKGMVPSSNSPDMQCEDCTTCPNNAFGSRGAGKACKNTRELALLPPDATADDQIMLMSVPPTAIKGFDGYVASVLRTFGMAPVSVVTSVTLDPNEDYFKPEFGNPVPNEQVATHFSRIDEAKQLLNTEPDVSSFGQEKAPAKKAPAKKAPARR